MTSNPSSITLHLLTDGAVAAFEYASDVQTYAKWPNDPACATTGTHVFNFAQTDRIAKFDLYTDPATGLLYRVDITPVVGFGVS